MRQSIGVVKTMTMSKPDDEVSVQAFGWVILMEEGPLTPSQERELAAWLARSPRHRGALVRASAASARWDRLGAFAGGHTVLPVPATFEGQRRRFLRIAAASAVGLAAGATGWWLKERTGTSRGVRYTTSVGQVWHGAFSDGSQLLLNTATELWIDDPAQPRALHLLRGEVLLTLASQSVRPVVVRFGGWVLRAIAAAFAIRQDRETWVTVTEGAVELWRAELWTLRERLVAGQEAFIDRDGLQHLRQLSDEEIQRRFAWRTGTLRFIGEPLGLVLQEMNRYHVRQIHCEDPHLCARQVTGSFAVHNVEAFLSALQGMFNLDVVTQGSDVLLAPRTHSN